MCTLTIHRGSDRFLVTMNRDEKRSRISEKSPFFWKDKNIFAPQDTQGGGTWAAINNHGVVACLLNGYSAKDADLDVQTSRGSIVPYVLGSLDPFAAAEKIKAQDYASFILYIIDDEKAYEHAWDGKTFNVYELKNTDWLFFTSSSYLQDEVKENRSEVFRGWEGRGASMVGVLPDIHILKNHEDKAFNTLMSRDDACTKSITQFEVGGAQQKIARYWGQPHDRLNEYEEFAV